jgi:hypothetical protein
LARTSTLSNQYSVLGRHRLHKVGENTTIAQDTANTSPEPRQATKVTQANSEEAANISSMGIPQFLKRMSMGILSK